MKNLAIFASGTGSNFDAIIDYIHKGKLNARVQLLICDKPDAKVVHKAKLANIPLFVFTPKDYATKEEYEEEILKQLITAKIDLIALAGYMRLVGHTLLRAYEGRIINIHPSLLPSFQGLDAIGQALNAGVKVTGVTIHFVDEGMDTGPIIAQEPVIIEEDESRSTLTKKIQEVEHRLYPETLMKLLQKEEVNS